MRRLLCSTLVVIALSIALKAAQASVDLDRWFFDATASQAKVKATQITKPDFLGGSSLSTNCHFPYNGKLPALAGVWQLLKYDRKHQIGLAYATTDQCSSALFKASPPPASVPDADLSQYGTARGLKIGSSYAQVLSTYGPPARHGQHFVAAYSASVPSTDLKNKPIKLPEIITLVIDDGKISSITIYVDEGGLF